MIGESTIPDTTNPKDVRGEAKVSITKLPSVALLHAARAMMDGAEKYGPYNWRDKRVRAHIYVDAALRHLLAWFEGEERASDSQVHHLGHVMACCAILLDAQATGNLVDDRPGGGKFPEVLAALNKVLKEKRSEERDRSVQNQRQIPCSGS